MAQKIIGNEDKELGVCERAIAALKSLFQLMRDRHINFGFMNLKHNSRLDGQHDHFTLTSQQLVDVQAEKGRVVILSDTAIFRIYERKNDSILEKMCELLAWAQEQIKLITSSKDDGFIEAPKTLEFYSAPKPA